MRIVSACILVSVVLAASALADTGSAEGKVRIGILNLEPFGNATENVVKSTEAVKEYINEIGFYNVYGQAELEAALNKVEKRMPSHCRDPRCVIDIGKITGMDRILYGSIDIHGDRCGVSLTLIDVIMRQKIETVNLEGAPGVPVTDILKSAIARLHGTTVPGPDLKVYNGPEIHNEKQLLFTSAGFIGLGLIFGLVNYAIESDKAQSFYGEYVDEELSGIASSADQIPLFARPAALANAYVAASHDAYGMFYNPAGVAWIAGPEIALAYQYRFGVVNNIAASFVNKATRELGFGQAFLYSADRDRILTEIYFISGFAYKFNHVPLIRPFSLGANLKLVSNRVQGTGEYSPSGSSFGAGIDVGLHWELSETIRYGLLLRDLPVVNRWKNVSTGESYFEPHAATMHMGGSFLAGYTTFLVAEGQIPLNDEQPWKMAGGIEQELFRVLLLRVGLQKEILNNIETPWKITGGFGLNVHRVHVDGSYEYNTLKLFDVINVSFRIGL